MEEPDERVEILSKYLESLVNVENLAFKDRALGPLRHITAWRPIAKLRLVHIYQNSALELVKLFLSSFKVSL